MDSSAHSQAQLSSDDTLIQAVHDSYSALAKSGTDISYANKVAHAFGYTIEQLQSIPAESHMGLSCGNPVAAASIKEGETVLDLGSGGGIDILLASARTGPRGQAIGLDMSSDMISLARRNALKKGLHPPQVAFVQTVLTNPLPIKSNSIDCVLSNCVINLLPPSGKANVFKETHRVLKPGGRLVLDDIIAKKPLPENVRNNLAAYVGCISGAIEIEVYNNLLTNAGFQDIVFIDTRGDLNVYFKNDSTFPGCCTPNVDTTTTQSSGGCCDAPKVDTTATQSTSGCRAAPKVGTAAPQSTGGCCAAPKVDTTAAQTTCGAPASKTTPLESPFKDFDANSWVASYQVYAIKSSTTTVGPETFPEPLLQWWDAYPSPKSSPAFITADELSALLRDTSRRDECTVIDVRGNNLGGRVRGSLQYPAQTFYNGLTPFAEKFVGTKQLVFYCGNSKGRAPRCASWYLDYLNGIGQSSPKVFVLHGGVASWLEKFRNEKELVDYE